MSGIAPGLYLFLLQQKYFKEDNPVEAMILLVVVGAVIILSLIIFLIRRATSAVVPGKSKANVIPRKFNVFTLHRISSAYGLDRKQTKLLEFVFRNDAVSDPARVMITPAILDRHFQQAFRVIEKNSTTDEDAQQRLSSLFSLRNAIEAAYGSEGASAESLAENTPAILVVGKDTYPVKVISSKGKNVVTEIPRSILGTPVRFNKGTKLSLSFFTKSSNGFSFDGHIVGTTTTEHGAGLQINHTGRAKPLVKRRFRRKQIEIECEFFIVNVKETGTEKKKTVKLVVDPRRHIGTIQDISAGGCALQTKSRIQAGSRLKISIEYNENYLINVLGQVIRSNRSGTRTILHIKFIKVPRRAFNSISTLVFGYNDN
jgi:hypothetical protein